MPFWNLVNSVPKPGTSLTRSQTINGPNGNVRWTRHSLDTGASNGQVAVSALGSDCACPTDMGGAGVLAPSDGAHTGPWPLKVSPVNLHTP